MSRFLVRLARIVALVSPMVMAPATCALAQSVLLSHAPYGTTREGRPVEQYMLSNAHGTVLKVITYGAIVTALDVRDRRGQAADIVLGFDRLADYERYNGAIHFGAAIGRYANRIAHGRFSLDGKTYRLPVNDGPNTLHGGPNGFDTKVWTVTGTQTDADMASITLRYVSPAGENGFPGTLTTDVTYALTADDRVRIAFHATTDADTVVNLTNHTYFNLGGQGSGSVENQLLRIAASRFTPTDETSIPTGKLADVEGAPMDFRTLTPIGAHLRAADPQLALAHGYDQNWVLDAGGGRDPGFAATAYDPASGRVLNVYTTQPGLQFYSANGLNGSVAGKGGLLYRQSDAFALEAEHFPDSPNHPAFPSTTLMPGQTLDEVTVWQFAIR